MNTRFTLHLHSGIMPSFLSYPDDGPPLATIGLPDDWMAGGSWEGMVVADGEVLYYRIYDRDECIAQGSCGTTLDASIRFDCATVQAGQLVHIRANPALVGS